MLSDVGLGQDCGQRLWKLHVNYLKHHLRQHWRITLHIRYGMVRNPLSHLTVFSCDAYVHVRKDKRTKLDIKCERCIFIGYKDGLKGYNLWNSEIRKLLYSQDVAFREVKYVIKHEVLPNERKKIEFEPQEEESYSTIEQ